MLSFRSALDTEATDGLRRLRLAAAASPMQGIGHLGTPIPVSSAELTGSGASVPTHRTPSHRYMLLSAGAVSEERMPTRTTLRVRPAMHA
jgi:hypothetical protein